MFNNKLNIILSKYIIQEKLIMIKKNITKKYKNNASKRSKTLKKLVIKQNGGDVNDLTDFIVNYDESKYKFELFKQILNNNKSYVNKVDDHGDTPLILAAYNGFSDIVTLLLENGADPNIHNKNGEIPLEYAVDEGHEEIVKLLLENNENYTEMDEDESEEESEEESEVVKDRYPKRKREEVDYSEKNQDNKLNAIIKMPTKKQQKLEETQRKLQKYRNKITVSGESVEELYNQMYDLVDRLNNHQFEIGDELVDITQLNKRYLNKLTEEIFPAALGKLQEMVDSFSIDINKNADIPIETDISTLVSKIEKINYKDIVEGEKTRSSGHSELIKLLFDQEFYLKNRKINFRAFFEPSSAETQCNNMFGTDWKDSKNCYICGVNGSNPRIILHCEHVLNIYQAAVTTGLYYKGMENDEMANKLRRLGLNEDADESQIEEIESEIEMDKDDLKNTVYDVACSCCNSIKTNYMFIDFNSDIWKWIVDKDGVKNVLKDVRNNNSYECKVINKETIFKRANTIYDNLESRCAILNEYFFPPNPKELGKDQRKRYYNLITLGNLLISFRPARLEQLIKGIMNGGRDINVIPQQTIFPGLEKNTMEYEPNIGKNNILVKNEEPKIKPANITLKQIVTLLQDDLNKRQHKLDTFFENFEKFVVNYQKEHPEVIQDRKKFDEIVENNPNAFKDGRPNPDFWLKRNKTGGKKTQKKNRSKKRKTKRRSRKRIKI
jgi:ankyrin repeat protein